MDFAFKQLVFEPSKRCRLFSLKNQSLSKLSFVQPHSVPAAWRGITPLDSAAFQSACKHWFSSLPCVLVISKSSINQLQPGNGISLAGETGMASAGQKTRLRRGGVNVCSPGWQWIFYADGWMASIKTYGEGHLGSHSRKPKAHVYMALISVNGLDGGSCSALSLPVQAKHSTYQESFSDFACVQNGCIKQTAVGNPTLRVSERSVLVCFTDTGVFLQKALE